MELPFADTVNYWKTNQSAPDSWIDKARRQIEKLGGTVTAEAFGRGADGRSAYMISFRINENDFRVVWPVLPVKNARDERAARVQAATMLYRDVKARCLSAVVLGARTAFFSYLLLPDGRQASEAATPEIGFLFPRLLSGGEREIVIVED